MHENENENYVQNTGNNIDKDTVKNLANNLTKNQGALDLGSIMQLATTLLKNDSLMNSVNELNKKRQNIAPSVAKSSEKLENGELASLSEKLENITNDMSALKEENNVLASAGQKLDNITNDILELKKELKAVKEQNNDVIKLLKKVLKTIKK
jgi:signal transduction histidine kinase